ncbi:MAG: large conductance mechanosensitive channel protein MscL [Gemmatimonadales bacterium]
MLAEFKKFLVETNAFALAIGVVVGAAVSKLVTTLVSGIFMPLLSLVLPGGAWREWKVPLGEGNALAIGDVLGAAVDFVIIAWVVYVVVAKVLKVQPKKA